MKTTIWKRFGDSKSYRSLKASTRSSAEPRQPSPGLAQLRVFSIEEEGIEYGDAISASNVSTKRAATPIVTTQSIR